MKKTVIVSDLLESIRIDLFLSDYEEELSRNAVQKLCLQGKVLLNDEIIDKKVKVKNGDIISIDIPEPVKLDTLPENIPLDIVFEDDYLLIVNKPSGMVVHPAPGNLTGTLVNALMYHCKDRLSGINGIIRPGIVHRIDKDTSGLLVIAKDDKTHLGLSKLFAVHNIIRTYDALVLGNFKESSGVIDKPIGRHPVDRKKMAVIEKNSRNAITNYEVVEEYNGYSYIKCKLETGRTHQIRVHMSYLNHPVLGDPLYGRENKVSKNDGQYLHAGVLGFIHPITEKKMLFKVEPPEKFKIMQEKLRKL